MQPFHVSRIPPVFYGPGRVRQLPETITQMGHKILLITGEQSLKKSGNLEKIKKALQERKIKLLDHLVMKAEPTSSEIDQICSEFRNKGIEVIVSIGGGSVIDTGKAISALLLQEASVLDFIEEVGRGLPYIGKKIPCIAIPTTAGTGSEVTRNAVLKRIGNDGYKKSFRHESLIPDAIILDPELILQCPAIVTAQCGMDALTQLLEGYMSPEASPLTDALAWSGLEKIKDGLLHTYFSEGPDIEVRGNLLYAAFLSGVVLTNAGLGVVHGMASALGGAFNIPHGIACGTLLASATKITIQALKMRNPSHIALKKYSKLSGLFYSSQQPLLEKPLKQNDDPCEALINKLYEWTEFLKIPTLRYYNIQETDLDKIASETSNKSNPIKLSKDEIKTILLSRL